MKAGTTLTETDDAIPDDVRDLAATITADEAAAVVDYVGRRKKVGPKVKVERSEGGTVSVSIGDRHPLVGEAQLALSIGTGDPAILNGLVTAAVNAVSTGGVPDEAKANFILGIVQDIQPRDSLEAMLAVQMATVHLLSMDAARRANTATAPAVYDAATTATTKHVRTFGALAETLRRHRTGGQQKVTVEHVHVHAGGQAIVGNVDTGGRRGRKLKTVASA